jgi:hypothetical protein
MLGTFVKSLVGVAAGAIVNYLIAKANIGSLTLGANSVPYSQIITVVVFFVIGYTIRGKNITVSQVSAVASASQLFLMLIKLAGVTI